MKNLFTLTIFCFSAQLFLISCISSDSRPLDQIVRGQVQSSINVSGRVPLSALFTFFTKEECQVSIDIIGEIPVHRSFTDFKKNHDIPILGLYPDTLNAVVLTLTDRSGLQYKGTVAVKTEPLPIFFPDIEISHLDKERMEPGMHLIELLIANEGKFDSYTIVYDDRGDIRWYLDMSETRRICFTTLRMNNGNSLYASWIDAFELDDLGRTVQQWQLGGYAGDHDIKELPDGNFLMGASKRETTVIKDEKPHKSRYDFAVELDRKTMNAIKEWDLRQVLDVDRSLLNDDIGRDNYYDWFHVNTVAHSPKDDCIIVSGRNQGVVKLDQDNKVRWLLAPHKGWGRAGPSGSGPETRDFLLTAIDHTGNPFPKDVQDGTSSTDDFEWVSGQHSVKVMDNGNILLFDNGFARQFIRNPTYSRAVEYEIDEKNKTIKQVWQYGKERGLDMYSAITSDVDILPKTNNRLITSGYIRLSDEAPHAKIIEVTYPENEVVFESKLYFKNIASKQENSWAKFDVVYKGERYFLFED